MSEKTILSLTDLKHGLWACFAAAVGLAVVAYQYQQGQIALTQSRITANYEGDAKRDVAIGALQSQLKTADDTGKRLEESLKEQRSLTSQMLLQMATLSGKVSSTEEISRNTQSRIEALNDYLRNERLDPKRGVLDSSSSRRPQGYAEP